MMAGVRSCKLLFATGPADRVPDLVEAMARTGDPALPLYVVAEFPPPRGEWIPYHPLRSPEDNRTRCLRKLGGAAIALAGIYLDRTVPYWPLRRLAFTVAPWRSWVFFTPDLNHFMLRPRSGPAIAKYAARQARDWLHYQLNPGGDVYTFFWRLRHPAHFRRPLAYQRARAAGEAMRRKKKLDPAPHPAMAEGRELEQGVTVIIPSRNGADLLARSLPLILAERPDEVIVVDNGSTEGWDPPEGVTLIRHAKPLSFAAAVNRGIKQARFSHVCLLNNDMFIEPGFFAALREPFASANDLFCTTAQIFFPEGKRREETGKAVLNPDAGARDFPLTCLEPLPGEDGTWVLYGSGGCSMYQTGMLRALGGFDEAYTPAYCEDLDLGIRAWQRDWATVYAAGARCVHHHRSTTARYYSEAELRRMVEVNYLRVLARTLDETEFPALWRRAIDRLNLLGAGHEPDPVCVEALEQAAELVKESRAAGRGAVLPLAYGDAYCFPGGSRARGPRVAIATCYPPYPLAHGGAVRMFNLMREADARGYRQVLITFTEEAAAAPPELLAICERVIYVRRRGSHYRKETRLPDVVTEFESAAFRAVLDRVAVESPPDLWQFEFTQMAQYARAGQRNLLVEHDITFDLYEQLAAAGGDDEVREQLARWREFETNAWGKFARVVVMSERDRRTVSAESNNAVVLPNGVDLERFTPADNAAAEPRRILFIGSFNHLPNLMAIGWFVREVWPKVAAPKRLHIIAGKRREYYLDFHRDKVKADISGENIEVEGFVADVRPAYRRAAVVIAPLLASAGTNIKVLEAMAMGKAVVSTAAGVHGLDLAAGEDFVLADTAEEFAGAITRLFADRGAMERQARRTVESRYGWGSIGERQDALYRHILGR